MKRITLLVCLFSLSACAQLGPRFTPVDFQGDEGVLYVYRPYNPASGWQSATVVVDGKRGYELYNGGYQVYHLSPGSHRLSIGHRVARVDITPGEASYLRFRYGWALFYILEFDGGQAKVMSDLEKAANEIAKTKLSMANNRQ